MGRGFIQICDGGLTFLKFQVNSDGLTVYLKKHNIYTFGNIASFGSYKDSQLVTT